MDITQEFAEWCRRKGYKVPPDTEARYYDMWELFLEDEYNEQRKWPQP